MSAGANEVAILVEDTGPGISEDIAAQLFKPFITTKPFNWFIMLLPSNSTCIIFWKYQNYVVLYI